MIVRPHARRRPRLELCLLDERGLARTERGHLVELDSLGSDRACYAWERQARELALSGHGELLSWCGTPIRYRPLGYSGSRWPVTVLGTQSEELSLERTLDELGRWRDWLGSFGSRPSGTMGSTAWDLLRATLRSELKTSGGSPPPLRGVIGGRQYVPASPLRVEGPVYHHDVRAAYARVLAGTPYGGRWEQVDGYSRGGRRVWELYGDAGLPTFVHCRVRLPELSLGPLPRHPAGSWPVSPQATMLRSLIGVEFPTDTRLQGVWSWQELRFALELGARLEQVFGAWCHFARSRPFAPYWAAVEEGRRMEGLAGLLAKIVGNALWGQFAIRPWGERQVTRYEGRRRVCDTQPVRGGRPRAFDLAEHVTGSVRAMLGRQVVHLGVETIATAHTDGLWSTSPDAEVETAGSWWRLKETADELRVLHAQAFSGYSDGAWHYTYAGVPLEQAEQTFELQWEKACRRRGGQPLYWRRDETPPARGAAPRGSHPRRRRETVGTPG